MRYQAVSYQQQPKGVKCSMPHFIDMPHGISFDLEELLHYQVKLGESYDPDIDYGVSRELSYKPVVLGRVDICGIMVICQPSPYLIRNGQT